MNGSPLLGSRRPLWTRLGAVLLSIVAATIVLHGTWHTNTSPTPFVDHGARSRGHTQGTGNDCRHLPGADKILILVKTGAGETHKKLPVHLLTTLQCVPNSMIFSDMEQTIGDTKVHDALAYVTETGRNQYENFTMYNSIKKSAEEGRDVTKLPGGWDLDKWKFLPMLFQAFDSAPPEIDWFVVIEDDTSLSWLNLLLWLNFADPQQTYYVGSQNLLDMVNFAHGGSGIVISRGAANKLVAARNSEPGGVEKYDRRWEEKTEVTCCGDVILAQAFLETGVELTPGWPMVQGDSLSTMRWMTEQWCTPAVTFHHATSEQLDALWQFQNDWASKYGWQKPYFYRDLFNHFIRPHMATNKTSWNNLSGGTEYSKVVTAVQARDLEAHVQHAPDSPEACAEACARLPETECIQWQWTTDKCRLAYTLRLGAGDEHNNVNWTSGWLMDRVEHMERQVDCREANWDAQQHFAD